MAQETGVTEVALEVGSVGQELVEVVGEAVDTAVNHLAEAPKDWALWVECR